MITVNKVKWEDVLLMVFLLVMQSHENLEDTSVTQLRRICKEKGVTATSWDRKILLKLIAGATVKRVINPVYNHPCFQHDIVLGVASSSEPSISKVNPPEAEGGRVTRSLMFANKGVFVTSVSPCSSEHCNSAEAP